VRIFDEHGKPVDADVVMSVYDKAIDAVAGGSNVGDLKKIFWGRRRTFNSIYEGCFGATSDMIYAKGFYFYEVLGLFGERVVQGSAKNRKANLTGLRGGAARFSRIGVAPKMRALKSEVEADAVEECEAVPMASPIPALGASAEESEGIRKDFADTAYWNAKLNMTGTQGVYRVKFKMPEDITGWNVKVWSMGVNGRVAEVATEIVTKKELMLRMITPRFFTEKDEVVVSAAIHNYGEKERKVTASILLDGVKTEGELSQRMFTLAPGGESRVDWRVKVRSSGKLKVLMKVTDGELSDGVEKEIDVVSHAIEKTESYFKRMTIHADIKAGVYDGEEGLKLYNELGFKMPPSSDAKNPRAVVEVVDSLAGVIDMSLDYLKYYEYECNEQTMNRFVPAAVARDVLVARGFEKRLHDVDKLIEQSLKKLSKRQNSDGGWGWFWGTYEYSYEYMTAVIVRGMAEAKKSRVAIPNGMLNRGVECLKRRQKESLGYIKRHGSRPWATDVLTAYAILLVDGGNADKTFMEMINRAYDIRLELPIYVQALLGLIFDIAGEIEKRDMIVRNLKQYIKDDYENGTKYLDLGVNNCWWSWYGNDIEAQAMALKLFLKIESEKELSRGLALYLFNNRKNRTHWTSTRDTGLAIEALAEYCRKVEKRDEYYVSAFLTYDSYEEPIKSAGLELKVNRVISRVEEYIDTSNVLGQKGRMMSFQKTKERLIKLNDGDSVQPGETLEIRIDIDSKNDYEYILVEDFKGAGFEPIDGKSGWKNFGGKYVYAEFCEKKTALFIRELSRGAHSLTYRVRVETPGKIHVLPSRIEAMYAPRLKGNSDEHRLTVSAPPAPARECSTTSAKTTPNSPLHFPPPKHASTSPYPKPPLFLAETAAS
jgi:hypothetical protein